MRSIPGKNVEVLVQAHQIADERRRRGLKSWAKSIPLKELIESDSENEDSQFLIKKCHDIAKLIKSAVDPRHLEFSNPEQYNSRIAEAIELLEGASDVDFDDIDDGFNWMNSLLADVYDYCDLNRIWTGA